MSATVQTNPKRITLQYSVALLFFFLHVNSFAQIYSNGNLSTGTVSKSGVTAPTSYTWSELQNDTGNTTETNKSTGFAGYFNTAGTTSFELGDNFTVPAGEQWSITSFDFFIHQNSYAGSTIPVNQLRIQIWNGDPSLPGSTVIVGDMTNNVLDAVGSGGNTFTYRIPSSIIGNPVIVPNTNRKIWKVRGTISASLTPGTYWVVYQFHATDNTSIFVPSVTVSGARTQVGWNAKQNFVANTSPGQALGWADIIDVGDPASAPDVSQDLPFAINGTVTLGTATTEFSSAVLIYPNPVKNSFTITMPQTAMIDGVEIYDMTGRKIKSIDNGDAIVNVSELSAGNYILKVKSGSSVAIKKFTKE